MFLEVRTVTHCGHLSVFSSWKNRKIPGHCSLPQELTSVPLPGHCLLTMSIMSSMGSEASMELQFLSLVLSPPPQDCEQELQALHRVHSGAEVNISTYPGTTVPG